jgi:hypothetical protein
VGRYTSQGAGDASTQITPGKEFPDPLTDFTIGAYATYEVDIWHKLHTKKAAVTRYLATVEGKIFVLTNLVAEWLIHTMNCKLWTTNSNCKTKYSASKSAVKITKKKLQGN